MRTIMTATTPYSKKDILNRAGRVTITKSRRGVITTKDGDNVLSVYAPTDNYEIVNFADAVKLLLATVAHIFCPEFYQIDIKTGFQELKLKGAQHIINGDVFHEMLWLTNSSNGSRRLSVRYGLMRQICSNGACITLKGSSFKIKHLISNNVNEELKQFMLELPRLDVMKQVKILKTIGNKTITVKELITNLNPKKTLEATPAWNDLIKKFASSKTDALGGKKDAIITDINVPIADMTKEVLDRPIPAWNVFNCYTELFRSADASMIELQTNKILEVLS
jgi:hypothetical protein